MPHLKKTPTTNKKKNKKLQQEKNTVEAKYKERLDTLGWIDDAKTNENFKFARTFNAKVFEYYKKNMIVFKIGDKDEKSIRHKIEKKVNRGLDSYDNYCILPFRCHKYLFRYEYIKELNELMENIKYEENVPIESIKDIFMNLIINNPKPNGKEDNFSIGFLGSIWIDAKDMNGKMFRIAFYNNGEKDYGNGFKPSIVFIDYFS